MRIYVGDPLLTPLTVWERVCGAVMGIAGRVGGTKASKKEVLLRGLHFKIFFVSSQYTIR